MTTIRTLNDLLDSREYDDTRFGNSSDDWINDPDRAARCHEAAAYGGDGSTHFEHISDWRETLSWLDVSDDVRESINAEIDDCEKWHINNNSIDRVIG